MATYYKYAEREADSYIDWSEISKSMSDMLKEEQKTREDKKAAIDKASREFGEILANSPQGEHKPASEAALAFGDQGSKFMLMQDRLLKSGQLSLKDYTIARQNILDDTNRTWSMLGNFQKKYKEKMDRAKNDESALYELEAMNRVQGFGDFSKSGFYINPATGKVTVAMKDKQTIDGQDVYTMSNNPQYMTSVDTLNGLLLGQWDKYDGNKATDAIAKANGKMIEAYKAKGMIVSLEDVTKQPDFVSAETNAINSALANDFNRLSYLTDTVKFSPAANNKQYRFVYTEDEAKDNPEAILMVLDPKTQSMVPKFTEEQLEISTEFMRTDLRRKYDRETKMTQLQAQYQPEYMYNAGKGEKTSLNTAGSWNQILMGQTPQEKKNAVDAVLASPDAQNKGLIGIDAETNPGQVTLTYLDPTKNITFNITDDGTSAGNAISLDDWAKKGSEIHGISDQKRSVEAGGFYGKKSSLNFKGTKAFRQGKDLSKETPALEMYGDFVEQVVPKDMTSDEESAVRILNNVFGGIGASIEKTFSGENAIEVIAPNGKTSQEIILGEDGEPMDPDAMQAIIDFIKANPKGENATDQATWAEGLKNTGVIKQKISSTPSPAGDKPNPTRAPR